MSALTTPTTRGGGGPVAAALDELDQRYHPAAGLRKQFNKVFPTHWSFMLGEVCLYSFIVLLVSGVYLALFFDPSMTEVTYDGVYQNLRGVEMSQAYASALNISFEFRGGLFVRQVHHWSALLFLAGMFAHMFRTFFTGAFRKPREANWAIGVVLILVGTFEGFTGYSLPDDLLSGTGLRIANAIALSVPVIGTWASWALFGAEFPGTEIIPRLYIIHVLLFPGILLALIGLHVGLVWYQKHTQFPGAGPHREERGRRPDPAGVRGQGRRVLRRLRRRHGDDGRAVPDQRDLAVRSLQPRAGLGRVAARLLHGLVGRLGAVVPGVGAGDRQLPHPGGVLGDGGVPAAVLRHRGRLPVPRAQDDRRQRAAQPAAAAA